MSGPTVVSPTVSPQPLGQSELELAAYNQNSETFRALNALMWQIPLIAMTLTGGLWFGVSSLSRESGLAYLRPGLLLLAAVGDLLLIVVLERLRHIIGEYLTWLRTALPAGHVAAPGDRWYNSSRIVKLSFQIMLGSAALISAVLCYLTMTTVTDDPARATPQAVVAWYDAHARELADGYEGLDAEKTHPRLFAMLRGVRGARILDVGAGTGRDAAALAALGHHVTAVDPSAKMLRLARALHPDLDIRWLIDAMPALGKVQGDYDVVLLSAVWMHVPPADRRAAFSRLVDLLAPGGRIYMTLRLGPADVDRAMWTVDADEVRGLASARGVVVTDLGVQPDLLGRDDVKWQTLVVSRPG
ncbi:MAG: class I SAM-dependent methyltransferase [Sphingomonas sp.]|uniref:class I SAM-dependent methyltransferase n=1 Tax=Sphingomonas sp. TaxID=28214 RepID=UPI00121F691E|nr:class I SAM-dependent methyltransferase [Sphingomonas sp.]THD34469.1 MAG: class I SAM-dependent methyltransferase [Sphingomonas sp.]